MRIDDATDDNRVNLRKILAGHGRFAYVINELDSTMTSFKYNELDGTLTLIETVSTLPGDFTGVSYCADVHVSPSGRFLYGSNRGHNSIAGFAVDPATGRLTPAGHAPTEAVPT